MTISRNNYEEYFLLYADKELSAAEKNMVETFVEQNPDLEEEFIMLQQSVVKPDTNIKIDKSSLYKTSDFINENNYEEKFLLYADNEISLPEIEETEKFVLANPSLQNEFTLLQQVKYEPDISIVFPDKGLLYKKENAGKVIPFRWKALAAAILLGVGLWTGINYLQQDKKEPVLVTNKNVPEKVPGKPIDDKTEKKDEQKNIVNSEKDLNEPLQDKETKNLLSANTQQQNNTVKNVQPVIKPETKLPHLKNEDAVIQNAVVTNDIVKPTNDLPQPLTDRQEPNDKSISKANTLKNNNYAIPASYIMDEEVKSDNYVFYNITAEEFKKSKVGTFLKKVKRTIEGKLPFKGNGLKIGNVEIAKDIQN